jgi:outer membrane protein assembly factor BamB
MSLSLGGSFLSSAQAAKVKVWHHHEPANYDKAQLKGAVVTSEGAVRLSRQLKPLAGLDATHVWAVVEDSAGNLLAATGDEGKIYKVAPDGKAAVLYATEDSQVFCLAASPDGSVYAGTGPSGQVLRIDPAGKAKIIHRADGTHIWSLAVAGQGETIYAGTGPTGAIYRLTPEGKATLFYQTKQEHVLCVGVGADGTVYAGTDKSGLVYRIDARGKGFILFNAPQSEVRRLLVTADAVYAGTSAPGARRRSNASGTTASGEGSSGSSASSRTSVSTGPREKVKVSEGNSTSSAAEPREGSKASPAPAPTPPASGENSVYRIGLDGSVRELFREKALVLDLLRVNGRLCVGTGMDGQLFEVDETTRERTEIARLDHGQVTSLCRRKDGSVVLGTGDPGKLYLLQEGHTAHGTVVSEVLDARLISRWGALRWRADTPSGTRVTVAARSGNVAEPDETWSDWSAEQTEPRHAVIAAPPARYLQYRVTLASDKPAVTPALHELTLRYQNTNQAPEVTSLEVPNLDAVNLDNPKKLKIKWAATDPNEDEVTFHLHVRKEGWKNWVQLEEDYEKKEYEWDTTTTPSGVYQLKVVASDHRDNSAETTLTGQRLSEPFVVSHTPPAVTLKVAGMDGDRAVIEATAIDPHVRLTAASFAVNGKKWTNVFPNDGLFDSMSEAFRFTTEALKPGSYVVVLRVRDAAGNVGSGDIVFTVQAPR